MHISVKEVDFIKSDKYSVIIYIFRNIYLFVILIRNNLLICFPVNWDVCICSCENKQISPTYADINYNILSVEPDVEQNT